MAVVNDAAFAAVVVAKFVDSAAVNFIGAADFVPPVVVSAAVAAEVDAAAAALFFVGDVVAGVAGNVTAAKVVTFAISVVGIAFVVVAAAAALAGASS